MSRARRHAVLRELLADAPASTQRSLVDGLESAGLPVTQATVSRDLAAIGALRGPDGYRLPGSVGGGGVAVAPATGGGRIAGVVREHAISVEVAAALVVLRTAPGHANFVASELDVARPEGMIGCIAGDDTIFLATGSGRSAAVLARELEGMME
jgi:transcriptional regulator of arginine metabolism